MVDILAKNIDKGIKRVSANIDKHEDGGINVEAKTSTGKAAGIWALKNMKIFLKDRWVGVLAHMGQEFVDHAIEGTKEFFEKTGKNGDKFF